MTHAARWQRRLELERAPERAAKWRRDTAVGAGAGAAAGAVGGAISGGVGIGALVGAVSGAVWSFLIGLFSAGSQPNPAYVNFVNRCLEEKGL